MKLYHCTTPDFDGILKNVSKLPDHNGEIGKILGLWCSEDRDFCEYFVRLQYNCDPLILEVKKTFDDSLIFDTRKKQHLEILTNLKINPNVHGIDAIYFFNYCMRLYEIAKEFGNPTSYFDIQLGLPSYQVADVLIPEIKKMGYKAICFSETLPSLIHQKERWHDDLDGKVSVLILDPHQNCVVDKI